MAGTGTIARMSASQEGGAIGAMSVAMAPANRRSPASFQVRTMRGGGIVEGDAALAQASKGRLVASVALISTSLHSLHCTRPNGAPQRGQARHQSIWLRLRLQGAHSTSPGVSHTAQRVGHSVSAMTSAAPRP